MMADVAARRTQAESALAAALLRGEARALSRAITAVENATEEARAVLTAIQPHLGRAVVVGVTGPPGAGKSTLINAVIGELRRRGKTVGVVAVDPSSPLTGGAILGDRIRMADHVADPGVFVRSLASRGHLGGLSRTAARVIDVMDAAGRDVVLVETVGAGQSEVEVAEVAGTKVVVCAPGLGDDVQAIKAGILEIADILVVNKGDLPLADRTVRQLRDMLHLRQPDAPEVPVLTTVATAGEGLAALVDAMFDSDAHHRRRGGADEPLRRTRRVLAETVARVAHDLVRDGAGPALDALCERIQRGEIDPETAAEQMLARGLGAIAPGESDA
jgi:LAO/AO transport system kinase